MKKINLKNVFWKSIKNLANLNFSIFLLLLISFFIMLGSIIEQEQNLSYYQTYYPFNDAFNKLSILLNWRLIIYFGLDHIYQTWWFIWILIIFSLSLASCTFFIQLPSLKNARRWKFLNPMINANMNNLVLDSSININNSYINIIYSLVYYNFYVFHKKYYVYGYKGLLGRVSPIFVHISIIFTLIGSICSAFFGYTVQEMVPRGEIFHTKTFVHAGFCSKLNPNFLFRVNNFFIDYNFDSSIKQFFSSLSVFANNGKLVNNKMISVNSPFNFNGLTIYQTDWNINSVRFIIGSKSKMLLQRKITKIKLNNKICWLFKIPISSHNQIFVIIFDLKNKFLISDSNGLIIADIFMNQKFYINNVLVCIQDIILDTGLQIKEDVGIPIIYFGFFILILSTFLSYISYCEIWLTIISDIFNLAGSTNRSVFFFEEDIAKINKTYSFYSFADLNNALVIYPYILQE
uniref:Cytochrome c biogenesis protein Ccs1 n=1 Tax=Dipterocladia arabiensis TaxID=2007176 RepID=A0A1Z1M0D2_9FLOR|nr:cytochrome c biogenesis protein ccs1 [Dipterocladia arabiensis]ARW59312.1 cytochrome c biogenesis protein ccs1 [Dipterocladia arabiensis]